MGSESNILIVCAGSPSDNEWLQSQAETSQLVVAVDGGANWLSDAGLHPDVFFGDCDSIERSILENLRNSDTAMNLAEVDKDQTDFELCLNWAIREYPQSQIRIVGAFGGRVDHELANLLLLASEQFSDKDLLMMSPTQQVKCLTDSASFSQENGKLLSLIPVGGDVVVSSTNGLKWPVINETLKFGPSLGISNEIIADEALVELNQGNLIAIQTLE